MRARQGKLKAVKFGRNWVIKKEWLNEYIQNFNGNEEASDISTPALTSVASAPAFENKITEIPKKNNFFDSLFLKLALAPLVMLLFLGLAVAVNDESYNEKILGFISSVSINISEAGVAMSEAGTALSDGVYDFNQNLDDGLADLFTDVKTFAENTVGETADKTATNYQLASLSFSGGVVSFSGSIVSQLAGLKNNFLDGYDFADSCVEDGVASIFIKTGSDGITPVETKSLAMLGNDVAGNVKQYWRWVFAQASEKSNETKNNYQLADNYIEEKVANAVYGIIDSASGNVSGFALVVNGGVYDFNRSFDGGVSFIFNEAKNKFNVLGKTFGSYGTEVTQSTKEVPQVVVQEFAQGQKETVVREIVSGLSDKDLAALRNEFNLKIFDLGAQVQALRVGGGGVGQIIQGGQCQTCKQCDNCKETVIERVISNITQINPVTQTTTNTITVDNTALESVKADVTVLKTDTTTLKTDVASLKLGNFSAINVSGLSSLNVLNVNSSTILGDASSDNLVVNAVSEFKAPVTLSADVILGSGKKLTLSDITIGSLVFAGTGGLVSQDNSNLFWDDTNNRLGIGTATPQKTMDIRGDLFIPATDTAVDCDGSTTTAAGTCSTTGDNATLVALGSNKLDFNNNGVADSQPLCVNSLTSPTIIAKDDDNNCANGAGTGTGTVILGTLGGTEIITATSAWAFKDGDGDGFLDDGEDLYIDNAPALKYYASGGTKFIFDSINGVVGIGATAPAAKLDIFGSGAQLRLSYDGSNYSTLNTGATGDLTIAPSGGDASFTGNVLPSTDSTYNLGSDSVRWANIYADSMTVGSTSVAGSVQVASGEWLGLGATKGRVVFNDAAEDNLTITGGHLLFSPDNTYDIGASGATRPRTGYFGTSLLANTMTLATGSITDSTGAISFNDENLSTTGTLGAGTTTLTGALTLNAQNELRFADSDSGNYVAFKSPATVASNVVWTLPSTDTATPGYALTSNGSGTLSWAQTGVNDATYITQTPNGSLSAEQALSVLATGLMQVTTGTGVVSSITTSVGIASLLGDETGSGVAVFATAPTIAGGSITGLTSLAVRDTSATFDVTLATTSSTALTAGKTLTIDMKNADNSLNFTAASAITFPSGTKTLLATDGSIAGLTGTISSTVLGNSNVYIGTTAVALNRGTGALSLTGVSIDGNAATVTFADAGDDTTTYVALGTDTTGSLSPRTDAGLTYNAATDILTATGFSGPINGTIGATTPTTGVFTTATINTGLVPDADDGAYLGQAGTAFSDLFFAEGGVINWDSDDLTLTQTGNVLALAGGDLDMGANIITNIGNTGTDFVATTGALNLAGTLTLAANANLTMTSGTGLYSQTYTGTSDAMTLTSSSTTDTKSVLKISQTGATVGTDYGLHLTNTGAGTTNVGGYLSASGATNNYGLIVENGSVGIGTATPAEKLTVRSDSTGATVSLLRLENLGTAAVNTAGKIDIVLNRTTGGATIMGTIEGTALSIDNTYYSGKLDIKTASDGVFTTMIEIGNPNIVFNRPISVNTGGDVGMDYDLTFMNTGTSNITSEGPLMILAGDANHAENLTLSTQASAAVAYTGTADAATTTTVITDAESSWIVDSLIGGTVKITSGTAIGEIREITDNATTTITVGTAFSAEPDSSEFYATPMAGDVIVDVRHSNLTSGGFKVMGLNDYVMKVTADGKIELNPFSTVAGSTAELRFKELTAYGVNYVGFKAPDSISANVIWTLPSADGTAGQVLSTNASGVLSWAAAGGSQTPWTGNVNADGYILYGDDSASGNLTIGSTSDATKGSVYLLDDNLQVCAGGACPTISSLSDTGNLVVENKIYLNGDNQNMPRHSCPTGWVLVPGNSSFGTEDFCVMKYEAKLDATTKNPVSVAAGAPWVNISWYEAKNACKRVGAHLITDPEWMTIARNIEALAINDMDDDAGVQLATGHSDNNPAATQVASAGSDPVISGCTLTSTMENASNAYSATSCEIQGDGSYGGDDNDKGFYLTGQAWSATGYSSGAANKSQLRVHVLSNGKVLWDIAGNIWEWTDAQCDTTSWYNTGGWVEWNNANLTDYEQTIGGSTANTSANGAGQYFGCTTSGDSFLRGGGYADFSDAGVFSLALTHAPTDVLTYQGFRCSR